jgi:hypothetical protein
MQQAEKQDYHPEWIFTGTALTDTSSVGRLYDRDQMAHTFGASSNPARTVPQISEPWRLYEWWYGTPPPHPKTVLAWGPVIQLLFIGIHLAGPHLTAETFAGAMFNYPPTGGTQVIGKNVLDLFAGGYLLGDTTPAISFGPRPDGSIDFVAVDDFTIAWWNPEAEGPDENGTIGRGLWTYSGMGVRLPLAEPNLPPELTEDFLFKEHLSQIGGPLFDQVKAFGLDDFRIAQALLDATPPLDRLPDYPPWPGSPAAIHEKGNT